MTMSPILNLLSYGDSAPTLLGQVTHAGSGHALIGRLRLGRDAWLGAGTVIRADGHYVEAGHDLHLGRAASVHIAHDVYPTLIGNHVTVGANAMVHACTVGDGCVIEEDAVVLDGSVLAEAVVLEAGSVVFPRSELTANTLYAGRPARPVRALSADEVASRRAALRTRNAAAAGDWAGSDSAPTIDPTAFIANTALMQGRVTVAAAASVWYGCRLDARAAPIRVGERSNVQDNSVLHPASTGIVIGTDTTIGHNVKIADCTIGDRCLIGIGSEVAPGTVAQDDCFLAAGAVTQPGQVLESGFLWGGNPARKLGPLDERKKALVLGTIVTYCGYAEELARAQAAAAAVRR